MGIAVGRDLTGGVCDYLTRAKRAVARTTFTPREQGTTQHAAHPPDTRVCAKSILPRAQECRVCARYRYLADSFLVRINSFTTARPSQHDSDSQTY